MTNSEQIEFSKDSVKISYRRFLTDSAPGVFLVFIITFSLPTQNISFVFENTNISIFIGICLLLLSPPLGLCINAASYFLFDNLLNKIEKKLYYHEAWPAKETKVFLNFNEISNKIAPENQKDEYDLFIYFSNKMLHVLVMFYHEFYSRIESIRAARIFFRSMILLTIISSFLFFSQFPFSHVELNIFFYFLILLFFIFLSSCSSFHFNLYVLYYSLEIAKAKSNNNTAINFKNAYELLINK